MELNKQRAQFYVFVEFKRGLKPTDIYWQLISIISDEKMFDLSTIQRLCAHYRNGLLHCNGDPHNAGRKSIEERTESCAND